MTKPKKYTQTLTCAECGKEFTVYRHWQRFCHPDCRLRHFVNTRKDSRDATNLQLENKRHQDLMMEGKRQAAKRNEVAPSADDKGTQVEEKAQSETIQKVRDAKKERAQLKAGRMAKKAAKGGGS
jgi:hypothetical protein